MRTWKAATGLKFRSFQVAQLKVIRLKNYLLTFMKQSKVVYLWIYFPMMNRNDGREERNRMGPLIKNGTIVTASDTYQADVLIDGEQIALIGRNLPADNHEVIDATGKLLLP